MDWHEMTAAEALQATLGALLLWGALIAPLCF